MTGPDVFALAGAGLAGLGLYGLVVAVEALRRLIAVNVATSGLFLLFGAVAGRGAEPDPVPLALIITGIVVAFAASALAVALVVAIARASPATPRRRR